MLQQVHLPRVSVSLETALNGAEAFLGMESLLLCV